MWILKKKVQLILSGITAAGSAGLLESCLSIDPKAKNLFIFITGNTSAGQQFKQHF